MMEKKIKEYIKQLKLKRYNIHKATTLPGEDVGYYSYLEGQFEIVCDIIVELEMLVRGNDNEQ